MKITNQPIRVTNELEEYKKDLASRLRFAVLDGAVDGCLNIPEVNALRRIVLEMEKPAIPTPAEPVWENVEVDLSNDPMCSPANVNIYRMWRSFVEEQTEKATAKVLAAPKVAIEWQSGRVEYERGSTGGFLMATRHYLAPDFEALLYTAFNQGLTVEIMTEVHDA